MLCNKPYVTCFSGSTKIKMFKGTKGWQFGVVKEEDTEEGTSQVIYNTKDIHQCGERLRLPG